MLSVRTDAEAPIDAEAIFRRLKGPNDEREHCVWLTQHRRALENVGGQPQHRLKRLFVEPGIADLLLLVEAAGDDQDVAWAREWRNGLREEELNPPPFVTGDDLIASGLKPGPRFKEWLERARDMQLDGALKSTNEALATVKSWAESGGL
jgi:poly(A) polymerase